MTFFYRIFYFFCFLTSFVLSSDILFRDRLLFFSIFGIIVDLFRRLFFLGMPFANGRHPSTVFIHLVSPGSHFAGLLLRCLHVGRGTCHVTSFRRHIRLITTAMATAKRLRRNKLPLLHSLTTDIQTVGYL